MGKHHPMMIHYLGVLVPRPMSAEDFLASCERIYPGHPVDVQQLVLDGLIVRTTRTDPAYGVIMLDQVALASQGRELLRQGG